MEEKAEDEAKKCDDKDERTKKPDEAKSGKDAERKKVQGGANNGRPVKLANLNRDAYFLNIIQSSFPCTDVGFSEPLPNHKPISYNITSRKNHVSVSQEQPGDGVLTSVALMKSLHIKSEVILCAF